MRLEFPIIENGDSGMTAAIYITISFEPFSGTVSIIYDTCTFQDGIILRIRQVQKLIVLFESLFKFRNMIMIKIYLIPTQTKLVVQGLNEIVC